MKARDILREAIGFTGRYPLFSCYYFLLMIVSECIVLINTLNVTVNKEFMSEVSDFSTIVKKSLPAALLNLIKSPLVPYVLVSCYTILLIIFLSVTFMIQSLLRKRDTAFTYQTIHAFNAVTRAPWTILFFIINAISVIFLPRLLFTATSDSPLAALSYMLILVVYMITIVIPFYYLQPLLYDNYTSCLSSMRTSCVYVKKSWITLFKVLLLLSFIYGLFLGALVACQLLIFPSLVLLSIRFLIRTYFVLLVVVSYNSVYNRIR